MATLIKAIVIGDSENDRIVENTVEQVQPKNGTDFKLAELYEMLACSLVEVLPMPDDRYIMIIDEEGKLTDKPMNMVATQRIAGMIFPGDYIVGNALICKQEEFK